jgi:hypothetical protein
MRRALWADTKSVTVPGEKIPGGCTAVALSGMYDCGKLARNSGFEEVSPARHETIPNLWADQWLEGHQLRVLFARHAVPDSLRPPQKVGVNSTIRLVRPARIGAMRLPPCGALAPC